MSLWSHPPFFSCLLDFLAMLMAARERDTGAAMSNKELIDELMTLIVAGHETTAAALTWTWYLISGHPETCLLYTSRCV